MTLADTITQVLQDQIHVQLSYRLIVSGHYLGLDGNAIAVLGAEVRKALDRAVEQVVNQQPKMDADAALRYLVEEARKAADDAVAHVLRVRQ